MPNSTQRHRHTGDAVSKREQPDVPLCVCVSFCKLCVFVFVRPQSLPKIFLKTRKKPPLFFLSLSSFFFLSLASLSEILALAG